MAAEPAAADRLRAVPAPEAEIEETHPKLRGALRLGLYAVLLLSPLPFGSVQPWAVLALELSAALLGAGALAILLTGPRDDPRPPWLPLALAGALVALGVFQVLPGGWGRTSAPGAPARAELAPFVPESAPATAPWSLAPPETVDATARLTAYVLLALAAFVAFRRDEHLVTLAVVIVASALFQAIYGSGEYLSGRDSIFAYKKKYYLDSATGTFINRNHFAGFLAMAAPFAVAPALTILTGATGRRRVTPTVVLATFAAAAVWMAILLSRSRGGLTAFCIAAFTAWALIGRRQVRLLVPTLVLTLPLFYLLYKDVAFPGERFSELGYEFSSDVGRWTVWRDVLGLSRQQPVLGSGLGTFEQSYAAGTTLRHHATYDHAHNEFVQLVSEGGSVALIMALGLLSTLGTLLFRLGPSNSVRHWLVAALVAALLAAVTHSMFDFSQRIPAIAVLTSVLGGIAVAIHRPPTNSLVRGENPR